MFACYLQQIIGTEEKIINLLLSAKVKVGKLINLSGS